ncbi:glycoside hydrolase family 3 N-terminal domain-containing protein [Acuticoccus mangrovi]|uniref:beta-N-acetylhexosaminidase n=1 Tax=Acuticoccus mangrovi TaxID=2796142 RepID=A0A934ICZ9_9HYPH|nr:glycoside hydrolase family 3 N-terminal domain-containing protein [Acuticoccus mangrovi]MBJ3774274.1 glycoside hydrolase family 3 protein [Acuticoccus mangrovi]
MRRPHRVLGVAAAALAGVALFVAAAASTADPMPQPAPRDAIGAVIEDGASPPAAPDAAAPAAPQEAAPAEVAPVPRAHPMALADRQAVEAERRAAFEQANVAAGLPADTTLDAMIGQMLMVGFEGDDMSDAGPRRIAQHIAAGRLGGVLLFRQNVSSERNVKAMNAAFREAAARYGTPVLIGVDQEGGMVERLRSKVGFPSTPSARKVATMGLPAADKIYRRLARGLAAWGFNINLGPVVDLSVRSDNPVITRMGRSYGRDPATVEAYASAFIAAHHAAGLLTTLKHFPGHGSSAGDTHRGFVDVSGSWTPRELEPFRTLIGEGRADIVMVAHVHLTGYGDDDAPATLSSGIIEGLLRRKLGYGGVVMSDDMEMGAIAKLGSSVDVATRAILSGNDILVYAGGAAPGGDLVRVLHHRIKRAAERDPKVAARIRESYGRIMRLKAGLGRS